MDKLKILGLNLDIQWKNKTQNFLQIEREFQNIIADVFLLPEMFATGFCMDAEEIADRNSETLAWMMSLAKNKQAVVAGSVSVYENKHFYNRFYFVFPDGNYAYYDKRHLFSYSGEEKIYTPGTERKIVAYKGFRILLQVCYDLRFPVFARNNNDYDVVLYIANWPVSRVDAWNHLLKARAIENQSFVFGLNRIGKDGNNLEYSESSSCFFADGSVISKSEKNLVSAELDMSKLLDYREKFQFINDRDLFQISM